MDYGIIKEIDLDFYNRKFISVEAKQYDTNSRYIIISCKNQGDSFVLDKNLHTAYIRYKKSDESIVFNSCEITDDGKVLIELTQQMLSSTGNCIADIMVFSVGDEPSNASTMTFYVNVIASPYANDEIESNDEFGALEDLLNKSLADYEYVMENAQQSADSAAESAKNAKTSETNASKSASAASTSASNAKTSESNAKNSAASAFESASTATIKATEASNSAKEAESYAHGNTGIRSGEDTDNGLYYKDQSSKSASAAKSSETNAKTSETNAKNSASSANISENNAKSYETNAFNYYASAEASASAAKSSETNAKTSETNAKSSETAAKSSQNAASTSASNASASASNAKESETAAKNSETASATHANNASESASTAITKAKEASDSAIEAKSYTHGQTGTRTGENSDNAKYYYEQALRISQGLEGALLPMGTITFDQLSTTSALPGYMYNISNAFTSDNRFKDGGNISYGAGNNVYYTADKMWDVLASSSVSGVKGDTEKTYRQGNVNITKENIGLGNVPNVATNDQTPTFKQATTRENIESGNTITVILGKVMKWFADLKSVAFSGSYSDLTGTPTSLPANGGTATNVSGVVAISNGGTGENTAEKAANALLSGLSTSTTIVDENNIIVQGAGVYSNVYYRESMSSLFNWIKSKLSVVATSGSYNDLSDKPNIPTITDTYSGTSSNGMSGKAVKSAIDALDGTVSDEINKLNTKIAALQKQIDAINASLPYKITFDGTTMTVTDEDRN